MFNKLINLYKRRVFSLAYKFTNDYEEAEDLSQEIFIKIYRKIDTFKYKSKFSTWLYKIATNICIDWNKKRTKVCKVENIDKVSLNNYNSTEELPEDLLLKAEMQAKVHSIIYEMPDIYKITIIMYHFNDMSYKEIAKALNIPKKTVETRLYRARRKLKDKLELDNNGGGLLEMHGSNAEN